MKRRWIHLLILGLWLCSTLWFSIQPTLAQDAQSLAADLDRDGLLNDQETQGWRNSAGVFVTDPLDPDSDDDGLTDGEEKLYNTNPLDPADPGIYIRYEEALRTKEYFHATDPEYLSMRQAGDTYLMTEAMVVRRGATFRIGGPQGAALTIDRGGYAASETPLVDYDFNMNTWVVAAPATGRTGIFTATLTWEGGQATMPLYVIFEIPTSLSQADLDAFLYNDDPTDLRDEVAVIWRTQLTLYCSNGSTWSCTDANYRQRRKSGYAEAFWTDQYKKYVFVDLVMPELHGRLTQGDATSALSTRADKESRVNWTTSYIKTDMKTILLRWWDGTGWTQNGSGCHSQAGVFAGFLRSAGIPATPFITDHKTGQYDTSVKVWYSYNGVEQWMAARSYARDEKADTYKYYPFTGGTTSARTLRDWGAVYVESSENVLVDIKNTWDFEVWTPKQSGVSCWGYMESGDGADCYLSGDVDTRWQPDPHMQFFARDYRWDSYMPLKWVDLNPDVASLTRALWTGRSWIPTSPVWGTTYYDLPNPYPGGNLNENWPIDPVAQDCPRGIKLSVGCPYPNTIGNLVWNDLDSDGVKDTNEVGLSGVGLTLTLLSPLTVYTTTTNSSGAYGFNALPVGTYELDVNAATLPAGAALTTEALPLSVTLATEETSNTAADIGYRLSGGMLRVNPTTPQPATQPASTGYTVFMPYIVAPTPPTPPAPVTFGEILSDRGVDTNRDGQFDTLTLAVSVTAARPGVYYLGATLGLPYPDGSYAELSSERSQVTLRAGAQTVTLSFDGLAIGTRQFNGPYAVTDLWVTDSAEFDPRLGAWEAVLDYQQPSYFTRAYTFAQFESLGAALVDKYAHRAADADGDGEVDTLHITLPLDITDAGAYRVQGDLYAADNQWIARSEWNGTTEAAVLQFNIAQTGGPYRLANVQLFDAQGALLDSRRDAATVEIADFQPITLVETAAEGTPLRLGEHITPTYVFAAYGVDADGDALYDQLVVDTQVTVAQAATYRVEGWLATAAGEPVLYGLSDPITLGVGAALTLSLPFDGRAINGYGDGPYTVVALNILSGAVGTYTVLDQAPVTGLVLDYDAADFEPDTVAHAAFADSVTPLSTVWQTWPALPIGGGAMAFDANAEGFTYADDVFGTTNPNKAAGNYVSSGGYLNSGALRVYLGPNTTSAMSGGWSKTFTLTQTETVRVFLRYFLRLGAGYETSDYVEARLRIDSTLYGNGTNNSLIRMTGNGNGGSNDESGWLSDEFVITLAAGAHTLTVGGYNNAAGATDEWAELFFDDIAIGNLWRLKQSAAPIPAYDAWELASPGYVSNTLAFSPTFTVDLSDYAAPRLKLTTAYSMNSASDFGYVEVANAKLPWTAVATYTHALAGRFVDLIDLPAFGEAADWQLRFRAAGQNGATWYVDDLALYAWPAVSTATITYTPASVATGISVTFAAEYTSITDTLPITYTWDFGDGTPEQIMTTETITHQFNTVGSYPVWLTVANPYDSATISTTIAILNQAPTDITLDNATIPETATLGAIVGAFSTVDPDAGDTHTYTLVSGDGDTDNATFTIVGAALKTAAALDYETHPTCSIRVKTDDGAGGVYEKAFVITITDVNHAPHAVDDAGSVDEGGTLNANVLTNDSDDEDDTLTVTTTPISAPGHGDLTLNADGSFTYEHDGSETLADSFIYEVCDDGEPVECATATVAITVNPVNDAPVALDDASYTVDEGHSLTVPAPGVLGNDSDAEGQTLTATVLTNVGYGTLTLNADGAFTYTHSGAEVFLDTFTYRVTDGQALSPAATVTITVNPLDDVPEAVDDFMTVAEDSVDYILDVLANDYDPEDDPLTIVALGALDRGGSAQTNGGVVTYTPASNYYGFETFTYTIHGNGGYATAAVSVTITNVNDAPIALDDSGETPEDTPLTLSVLTNDSDIDGDELHIAAAGPAEHGAVTYLAQSITYTPTQDFYGTDAFTYTAADGQGGSATAQVHITVTAVNDAPTAVVDEPGVLEDSAGNVLAILSNDFDVDGDPLTLVALGVPSEGGVAVIAGNTAVYTPTADFAGIETFTYTIGDGQGNFAEGLVAVNVESVNDIPIAVDDVGVLAEDTSLQLNVLDNDADVDGDELHVFAAGIAAHGDVTHTILYETYTPSPDFYGMDTFTYTVTDEHGGMSTAWVTVTVEAVNDAPVVSDIPNQTITAGETFTTLNLDDYVSDVDNSDAEMTWGYAGNSDLTVAIVDRVATITTPGAEWTGSEVITFTAADPALASDNDTATFTVQAAGPKFTLTPNSVITNTPYAQHVYTLTLTNEDTAADTYALTYSAADNSALPAGQANLYEWVVKLSTASVTVPAGGSADVLVTVEIPAYEVKWVTHTVTLTATSQNTAHALNANLTTSTGGRWNGSKWVYCRFDILGVGQVIMADAYMVASKNLQVYPPYDYFHLGQVIMADAYLVAGKNLVTCAP